MKWMAEGDAPSKYFFAMWRAKTMQDEIRSLQLDDGTITEDPRKIMQEIRSFYEKLYCEEGETQAIKDRRKEMAAPAKKGVLKLIPKCEERGKLTNLRPLTLLGITYKIVSKILADRIKSLLPELVSGQQTGFVPERTIFDNILALKLGEEWAVESNQEAILLKLDFTKAYDHVRHSSFGIHLMQWDLALK
ncbi:hypothetical protein R1sor_009724 [Riccia sorocarpa]|uniref:Reverse transcriptase domain-containing protein n=1 Tax=Riccia sorocarpa TaxID=122646 RepID=A0ABD3HW75_9MARC